MDMNGLKGKKHRILMWKPDGKRPFGRPKWRCNGNIETGSRKTCFEEGKVLEFPQDVPYRGSGTSGIRWGIGIVLFLTLERPTVNGHIRFRPQLIVYPSRGKSWYQFAPTTSSRYNILFGPQFVTSK